MNKFLSRLIPRALKPLLRKLRHFVSYDFAVFMGWRDRFIPPPWLHLVGKSDFRETGEEFFKFFVSLAGLRPDERVLDVGCGTGRLAFQLSRYLTIGAYEGIDIVKPSIEWCRQAYARRHPNFHFHFTDLHNQEYNPDGKHHASEYKFPFETSSFDFVFLTSVFTHMLPEDLENYLSEVARVLKSGGRCLITLFLLNPEALALIEEGASAYSFKYVRPGCRVEFEDSPEGVVAYDESTIRSMYQQCGLNIAEPIHFGKWCGRKNGLSWQDIIIASPILRC